jgi:hypothetical protein
VEGGLPQRRDHQVSLKTVHLAAKI